MFNFILVSTAGLGLSITAFSAFENPGTSSEPTTLMLLGIGLFALSSISRRLMAPRIEPAKVSSFSTEGASTAIKVSATADM